MTVRKHSPAAARRPSSHGGAKIGRSLREAQPRHFLLAIAVSLAVTRVLVTSESAGEDAAGMFFSLAWTALGLLSGWIGWRNRDTAWRFAATDVTVIAFAAWFGVSAVATFGDGSPRPAVNGAWLWVSFALMYLVLRRLLQSDGERRALVAVFVSLAFAQAVYGVEQFAWELPKLRSDYKKDPESYLRNLNIALPEGSRERMLFDERLKSTEPFASFALANSLAGFLAPWLIVGATLAFGAANEGSLPRRTWTWPLATCAAVLACLLLTKSRSAVLATLAGAAAWTLANSRVRAAMRLRWLLSGGAALGLLAVGAILLGGLDAQVFTEAGKSLGYRGQYWRSAADMIADHPLFGVGPGNFQDVYTQYKLPTASEVVADPHNFLMEVAAVAGLPALLALLSIAPAAWWEFRRRQALPLDSTTPADGDASRWIVGGGLAGFALALPISLLATAGLSVSAFLVALPAMIAGLAAWHAWGIGGRFSPWSAVVGVMVLLVNLLAAGGIGIPAVSGTLWVLLAILLSVGTTPVAAAARASGWFPAVLATVCASLAVTCYVTAYRPTATAQVESQQATAAQQVGNFAAVESHRLNATIADPWDAQPWRELAAWRFARWRAEPSLERWEATATAIDEGLRRSPRSSVAWRQAGAWRRAAYERRLTPDLLASAVAAYEKAVELYPNQAGYRAELAQVLDLVGRRVAAQSQAAKALELDNLTPHADQKLTQEERRAVKRLLAVQQGE